MALWIPQTLDLPRTPAGGTLKLDHHQVVFDQEGEPHGFLVFQPETSHDAHVLALAFRKAARRLEEIGRGLM